MSNADDSRLLLQDFEPSGVRLKRRLRLILSKTTRNKQQTERKATLFEFLLYLLFLTIVTLIGMINRSSEDIFITHNSLRRLFINKLELASVKNIDTFWEYLHRFNEQLYRNSVLLNSSKSQSNEQELYQLLLLDENFILGIPRLRQIRVNNSHCRPTVELDSTNFSCYATYDKSIEHRDSFSLPMGEKYQYTSSKSTSAFSFSHIEGPYDRGGFIYQFHMNKSLNNEQTIKLQRNQWLDLSTRAIFIEVFSFNPNTELLTSLNILFEFLTTGSVEAKEILYTVPLTGYFYNRKKMLGLLQICSIIGYVIFGFYYVSQLAEYRLWFILSFYWNLYDLGLLILYTILFYYDVLFLMNIRRVLLSLSIFKEDIFKDLVHFVEIQLIRHQLETYITVAILIRLLRFLPDCSTLMSNLLHVFYRSIMNSIGFLVLFFLIFISFVFIANFLYGDELYEFHTFALSSYTLIRCTLGQFEYDRIYRVSSTWTPIFYMVFVCVVYFVLLNLLVAVVNESYILGKQEKQQIREDLNEEYMRRTNKDSFKAFRRAQRPSLQMEIIALVECMFKYFLNRSIASDDRATVNTNDSDESAFLEDRRIMILENLQKKLIEDGFDRKFVEKFLKRFSSTKNEAGSGDEDDDEFIFKMEEQESIRLLYSDFKVFHSQYEKLAQDWKQTTNAHREIIIANTVDLAQAEFINEQLVVLNTKILNLESLLPQTVDKIVELYKNHFSIN